MSRRKFLVSIIVLKMVILAIWFSPYILKGSPVYAETREISTQMSRSYNPIADGEKERSLIASFAARQKEIDAREREVKVKEERLLSIEKDVDARIAELNAVRGRIDELIKKVDEINGDRIKKIVKIYDMMRPEDAAVRLQKANEDMAVMILSSLSEKKAAKILSFMDVNQSVKLSQDMEIKK